MKICLDPGHYDSYNPGVAAGYTEGDFTWTYYQMMKERLERFGVEIVCTRESKDTYPGYPGDDKLQARGKMAEGCDLFISIHSNAPSKELKEEDPEAYYSKNQVVTHWSVRSGGEMIAKKICNAISNLLRSEWGSINSPEMYAVESEKHPGYDYYGVLKGAASVGVPAIIVEHSFHTFAEYCEWVMAGNNMERMCDVEVGAIVEFYGLSPVTNDPYYIYLDKDLKKGDKGDDVKKMQMRFRQINADFDLEVKDHSFKNGIPDGSFGGKMEQTVRKFQEIIGLPESGILDAATRMALNRTVTEYSNYVTELIKEKTEMHDFYEKELLEADHRLQEANVKIESAIHILQE